MAIDIKTIPMLCDEEAEKFIEKAERAYSLRNSIDFSEEVKLAGSILEKAKMK